MTKQEMLAEVEAKIRKDIPRLMELREGCLLIKNEKHDNALKRGEVVKISCMWNDVIQVSPIGEPFSSNYIECQINDLFEIIGHDIMLNNVLEWLSYLGFFTECSNINFGGDTFCRSELVYDDDGNFLYKKTTFCEWNLPSPYLKDQSDEMIRFLYDLKINKICY